MALSTVISAGRPQHRTARVGPDAYHGALPALDFANGQSITLSSGSQQSSAFDTANDRVVVVTFGNRGSVNTCFISVGTSPTASEGAGSLSIATPGPPVMVYVPAGMLIAALCPAGTANAFLSMIPALLSGN